MASHSRIERCNNCGIQTSAARCEVCGGVTKYRALPGPRAVARGPTSGWLRRLTSLWPSASVAARLRRWPRMAKAAVSSGRPASYPRGRGKKRGVLCGVSYVGKKYELQGTVNDVTYMKFLLTSRFGFTEDCILVLTEEEPDADRFPTGANIRTAMRWLVDGCQPGDSLVFHFSGHGSQKVDVPASAGADERDGFDETICPVDYEANGMILDDEINETLVRPIPTGAKLHAIIDACHSGTVLDLPYLCRINRAGYFQWEDHRPPPNIHKGTSGGLAICISGCADYQTSVDTPALSRMTATGAMTYSLILAIETEPGTTYGRLLTNMRSVIRGANTSTKFTGPIASYVRRVFNYGLTQEPQLSSSEMFDIYRKPFLL